MKKAVDSFDQSIQRTRTLGGLFTAIKSLTTSAIDPSDILRSQIVFAVSALDYLVHEIVLCGVLEIYDGTRESTGAYDKFHIPLGGLGGFNKFVLDRGSFESIVREKHGYLAFQKPEKIADAVRLFSNILLWDSVGRVIGQDSKRIKDRLSLIVDRRNKIAHESDMDPSYPGARWPISEKDTSDVIIFVETLGHSIYEVCKLP